MSVSVTVDSAARARLAMPETISHEAESTSHCELNIFQRREIRE